VCCVVLFLLCVCVCVCVTSFSSYRNKEVQGGGSSCGRLWSCSCRVVCCVVLFLLCVCVCVTSYSSYRNKEVRGGGSLCGRLWSCSCRVVCCVVLFVLCVCVCDLFFFLQVLTRHPHMRGGWFNFYHKSDPIGFALQNSFPAAVARDSLLTARAKNGLSQSKREPTLAVAPIGDVAGFVRPVAQALAYVWQDTNWRE